MIETRREESGAEFSNCRMYRYALWRLWDASKPPALFVGLNPSTADEHQDDPTIRRCRGFAQSWGHGGLVMCNVFAFRATQPDVMKEAADPIGPENDTIVLEWARKSGVIVAAWGTHGEYMNGGVRVHRLLKDAGHTLHYLALSKNGHPRHPLYLRADLTPVEL